MKRKCTEKLVCAIGMLALFTIIFNHVPMIVSAENAQNLSGEVVTLQSATDALDAPSEDANVVHSFTVGESAFVTGEENGFKTVFWKGQILYIKEGFTLKNAGVADAAQSEEKETAPMDDGVVIGEVLKADLDKEFEQAAMEDVAVVESYIRQEEAKKRALIWRIVIGALVFGILVVSVIIGIKNSKSESVEAKG